MKYMGNDLVGILVRIYNKCMEEGYFPPIWKTAEVVWLPKEDGTMRPICLLPILGKILDRLLTGRIAHHMEKNKKFNDFKYLQQAPGK